MKRSLVLASLAVMFCSGVCAHADDGSGSCGWPWFATNFNAVVFGGFTAAGGDTEGRLAVCGKATFSSGYSVGMPVAGLPLPTYANATTDILIVGGDLHDGAFGVNGNIVHGGMRYGPYRWMPNGNVVLQVTNITFDASGNVSRDGTGYTPEQLLESACMVSAAMAALPESGVVTKDFSSPWQRFLTGTNDTLNVFNVTAQAWSMKSSQLVIKAPAGSSVLVNITGDAVAITNSSIKLVGVDQRHVLYNYPNATWVSTKSFLHPGSVLAPYASAALSGGSINGTAVFGGDVTTTIGFEFHNFPFIGSMAAISANEAPVVDAGSDFEVILGFERNLSGTVSDDGHPSEGALVASWSVGAGDAASVDFADESKPSTSVRFTAAGAYTLVLTASDGVLESTDSVVVTVLSTPNRPPAVDAGPDVVLESFAPVTLAGCVSDDGLPDGASLTTRWQVMGGHATAVEINDATLTNATVTFSAESDYVLRLIASDTQAVAQDTVRVVVRMPNEAPVADAGEDFVTVAGALNELRGVVGDDGKPLDGVLATQWSVVTGDVAAVEFNNSSMAATHARFTQIGPYVLQLSASDGVFTACDTVAVTVVSTPNQPPVVDAGPDQVVSLYASCKLLGSFTDDGLPEGGAKTSTWSQIGGPGVALIDDVAHLSPVAEFPAPGLYRFKLEGSDGSMTSFDETTVQVTLENQPPVVDAGADFEVTQGTRTLLQGRVVDDGLPIGGAASNQWLVVSGPGQAVFERPDFATTPVLVSTSGEYCFRLRFSDGELEASDEVVVRFGSAPNQPPTVDAGPDREVDFNLVRTDNLIVNPGAEINVTNGVVVGWTQKGAAWLTPSATSLGLTAVEGNAVFRPSASPLAELQQDVDVSLFFDTIEEGRQLFEFSVSYRVSEQVRYDEPRVRVEYRSEEGAVLAVSDISPTPISSNWGLLADTRMAPQQTRSIRVCLIGANSGVNAANDVYFDAVTLRGVELAPVSLPGSVLDDGLPEGGELTWTWRMVSGPVAAIFEETSALDAKVFFSAPGTYELALEASDGEMRADDHVAVSVVDQGGGQPLCVDAGTNLVVKLPLAIALPVGVAGGSSTNDLTLSWTEVSGSARVFIEHSDTLHPRVRFYEMGEYTLRLSVSDGIQVAYDEMLVQVTHPEFLVPMDVVMVIDKSGSMSGEKIVNARLAAQRFVGRLTSVDRAAVVAFDSGASLLQELTFDHQQAVSAISPIISSGGTAIDQGISIACNHLVAAGRPDAEWVIVLLSDGGSSYPLALAASQTAQASGIRMLSVGLGSGTDERLMSDVASSKADYFFAKDSFKLEDLYASFSRAFCRIGEESLEVFAGPTLRLPNVETRAELKGRVSLGQSMSLLYPFTAEWTLVSGPGAVAFENAASPVTTALFSESGVYTLALTGRVNFEGALLFEKTRRLTVLVDQPSSSYPPSGLVALWQGEGNAFDSIANLHGIEPYGLKYTDGAVHQSFAFGGEPHVVRVPTYGQLDVGQSSSGFTVEFWARFDIPTGVEDVFGWYDANGALLVGLQKQNSVNRVLILKMRNTAGSNRTFYTPSDTYTTNRWHHFAMVYDRSSGDVCLYRDGLYLSKGTGLGTDGCATSGDVYFGGKPDGSQPMRGGLDEVGVYNRPLGAEEVWAVAVADPHGKLVLGANEKPLVDAGPDPSGASIASIVLLSGTASDDGLPLGSRLRTRWSKLVGPGDVTFGDPVSLATTATFTAPGVYTLQVAADDGVARVCDTLRVVVGGGESLLPPSGLRAHWPAEGTGHEVVSGFDARPVGPVSYAPGKVGNGFDHGAGGMMLARTDGELDVGASSNGFTVEFWTRIDSYVAEQVVAGWYDASGAQFSIVKANNASRFFRIQMRDATGQPRSFSTSSYTFTQAQWHHFAFAYDTITGKLSVFRDGVFLQSLALQTGGYSTSGDFCIGGLIGSAVTLNGATDEVSVYDRCLRPEEIFALYAVRDGKAVMGKNLPPVVDAGVDVSLFSTNSALTLTGIASDDGLPLGGVLRTRWRSLSGSGDASFADAASLATTVLFSAPGVYVLELAADDGLVVSRDTLRVAVDWSEGALLPPSGLRAHWPAEGDGHEVVSGFDACPVGPVSYAPGKVGNGFEHGAGGMMLARTSGELDVGTSTNGFTVEFWTRIDSYVAEQVVAGWYDASGAQFSIVKANNASRFFRIQMRDATGQTRSFNTSSYTYTLAQWHHFAFAYDTITGKLSVFRDGVFLLSLALQTGGFSTSGDFCLGGLTDSAVTLNGAMDEASVYDRCLRPEEIFAIYAAPRGKAVMADNRAPIAFAGTDLAIASVDRHAELDGVVVDDGLPGAEIAVRWRKLVGPGNVDFANIAAPQTQANFDAPGIYVLELSADDGIAVSRDTVRIEVARIQALDAPLGLCAHWPAEGNGNEVVGGFNAYSVGAVSYAPGKVGAGFEHGAGGMMLVRTDGELDVGTSTNGFTVEFWTRIDSYVNEQVLAGWYDASGAQFSIVKPNASSRFFRIQMRDATGQTRSFNTSSYTYTLAQWHHFAFAYDTITGTLSVFRDGVFLLSHNLPAGGFPTTGDFCIGGLTDSAVTLNGAMDEICVYARALSASEIQAVFASGSEGKVTLQANQKPFAFAGYARVLGDVLSFSLAGIVRDDGCPTNGVLSTAWTQIGGPADAEILDLSDPATDVAVPSYGIYTFRLTAFDGELSATSDVVIELRTSTPANIPPTVTAGEPLEITLPTAATLAGAASDPDDGPLPLSTTWSRATGPAEVVFADASSPVTTATFSAPGVYLLRLNATDGEATVLSHVAVVVNPYVANAAPIVEAGDGGAVPQWAIVSLAGAASDDGLPKPLMTEWMCLSGPASVVIETPHALDSRVQFTQIGTYVLQLRAFDGEKQSLDTVTYTVVDPSNQPPLVDAGNSVSGIVGEAIPLSPSVSDDGLPEGRITQTWIYESGMGGCEWSRNATGDLFATFSKVGNHVLKLTVADGDYAVSDTCVVSITAPGREGPSISLTTPTVGQHVPAGGSLALEADASDPDGSIAWVSFYADDVCLGTVTNGIPYRWVWNNLVPGPHTIVAIAFNEIAQQQSSEAVEIQVLPVEPGIDLVAPAEGSYHLVDQPIIMQAALRGAAAFDAVEFLVDGVSVATRTAPPYVAAYSPATSGTIQLQARALVGGAASLVSDSVSVNIVASTGEPPVVSISAPVHGGTVTSPIDITGVVFGGSLSAYRLQIRSCLDAANDDAWQTLDSGTAPLGAAGSPAKLGTLDPTLMRNGECELRLVADDVFGDSYVEDGHTVVLDGGMKVGPFQLSFEDLNIPLVGIPVQITRSYDSRGTAAADFGPDWELGFRSVQVQTSAPVGSGWEDYVIRTQMGIPFYGIRPVRRHVVSVVVGDEVQQFEAYSPTEQGFFPLDNAAVAFRPINGSLGTLSLQAADMGNQFVTRNGDEVQLMDIESLDALDPKNWVYTTPDGTRLDIQKLFGLRRLTDRNANSLTFSVTGVTHSSGESIAFTRDANGRVTVVATPDGATLHYEYDAFGYLAAFVNRAGETTRFEYVAHPADPGRRLLQNIVDPLGNRALAAGYDDDGRLVRQTDASGHAVVFTHDIPNRRHTVTDRLGNATVHEYDLRGNIVRTVDALGYVTTRTYDDFDNEISVADPLGNTTTYTYDAKRNKLTETDALGHTTRTTYNQSNQPLTITDAKGNVSAFTYDARGNVTSMTDALGHTSAFAYNGNGELLSMTDATGISTVFTYDSRGQIIATVVTDATGGVIRATSSVYDNRGNQIANIAFRTMYGNDGAVIGTEAVTNRYEYDSGNRVTKTIYPDGTTSKTEYNAAGKETRTVDALGLATENAYDAKGNLVRTDNSDGTSTVWSYDAEDRQISEIRYDADGNVVGASSTEYDALGRQIAVVQADSLDASGQPVGSVESTIYDEIGRVVISYDARDNATVYEYDSACGSIRNSARVINALGHVTSYEYDADGNKTAVIDASGRITEFTYDEQNRPVCVTHPDGTTTETVYDAGGRRSAVIDELGRRTDYTYDSLGRLVEVLQPAPAAQAPRPSTRFAYDESGNRIAQTDALGRTTRYRYDGMGRRIARILPGGEVESCTYNAVGQLSARTDFNDYTTTFAYDAYGRLVEEAADPTHPSLSLAHVASRNTYAFDASGRPVYRCVWNGEDDLLHEEALSYDLADRLVEAVTTCGTLAYDYDDAGNLTGVVSGNANGVALEYAYDALNRLQNVYDFGSSTSILEHAYAYTPVGSLESVAYANGVTHAYAYNGRNRLTDLQITGAQSTLLNSFGYQLNAVGHRTQIDEANGRTRLFQYDNLNRLTSEQITGDAAGANGTVTYTHDLVGNRITSASTLPGVGSQSNSYSVNDRLDSDTCDDNGNTVAASGITSGDVYDAWNRLIRRTKPDGTVVDLGYDHAGNRVSKTVSTSTNEAFTAYLVDANSLTGYAQVLEELRDDAAGGLEVFRTYAIGHDVLSQTTHTPTSPHTHTRYYLYDGQGSVWGLADESGAVTDYYAYDAFGVHLYEAGAGTPNTIRYTGEQFDADLGQYYLRARYYEPTRGRFWTQDSYEGSPSDPISLHKYLYANASPVIYSDPSGKFSSFEISIGVGIISTVSTICALNHLFLYTQALYPDYLRNFEMLEDGVLVDDFYEPVRKALDATQEYAASELKSNYVYGPLLDSFGAAFEAARVLRFAKNVDQAMEVPNDLLRYKEVMSRMGYKWVSKSNNKFVGGNWVRPSGKKDVLPPPEEAYKAYKELVLGLDN